MGKHSKTKDDEIELNLQVKENDNSKKIKRKEQEINPDTKNKVKEPKVKKKKKHIFLKIFLLFFIVFIIVVIKRLYDANWNILGAILGHNQETLKNLDKIQVLILGESTGMSDTIIVASYDPKTQEAALLSIPRDTFTGTEKKNAKYYQKINALYNYGENPEKTLEAVNTITGLDIKYYILVDTEALIKLVDTIGGLDFNVPINMDYDDPSQDVYIHLKAGYQKLNGSQVEQLVRFRHNNNGSTYPYSYGQEDHGRNRTQREVIIAIAKQSLKFKTVTEISNIIDIFNTYVKTNMNLNIIKDYVPYATNLDMSTIKVGMLPGKDDKVNEIWFFFYDEEKTKQLVDELFNSSTEVVDNEQENSTNTVNQTSSNTAISNTVNNNTVSNNTSKD